MDYLKIWKFFLKDILILVYAYSIVNLAAGLSKVGLIPFVHTIAPFLIQRSYEQIKLDFGYQKLNINLISVGSSFDYSKLGCSHHCYEDVGNLKHFKKSRIFIPGSSKELNKMLMKNYQKIILTIFDYLSIKT